MQIPRSGSALTRCKLSMNTLLISSPLRKQLDWMARASCRMLPLKSSGWKNILIPIRTPFEKRAVRRGWRWRFTAACARNLGVNRWKISGLILKMVMGTAPVTKKTRTRFRRRRIWRREPRSGRCRRSSEFASSRLTRSRVRGSAAAEFSRDAAEGELAGGGGGAGRDSRAARVGVAAADWVVARGVDDRNAAIDFE